MYTYTSFDQAMVDERVAQFKDQTERYLKGTLSEDEYRPLRLQNGLYVQRYAPMLRIAIPYGLLDSRQLRAIADISKEFDRGYAHVSTRQNFQLNWLHLEDAPEILARLAKVQLHAIQTSGNCIRNTTTDQYAGVIKDEVEDPRPTCELIRQWSTFHPEFAFLPRKFKIAINSEVKHDRAATAFHDVGIYIRRDEANNLVYDILVGGGLGRTPMIGSIIKKNLPQTDLIAYLEAVLRIYNLLGRRDNKYKARIKILVKALTPEVFAELVEKEFVQIKDDLQLSPEILEGLAKQFDRPAYDESLQDTDLSGLFKNNKAFSNWYRHNTHAHKQPGYRIVNISLKRRGIAPGDVDHHEMYLIAELAEKYSFGQLRTTHEQNMVLADVPQKDLYDLYAILEQNNLATANINTLTNIVCCPGGDYCSLANAQSIPIAEAIMQRFDDLDHVYSLGSLSLNISGCMNACGHHHVGNIGILGVDKKGAAYYQVSLGGDAGKNAHLGEILGPSFGAADIPDIIEEIINTYLDLRQDNEQFNQTFRRVGIEPFKERVYAS